MAVVPLIYGSPAQNTARTPGCWLIRESAALALKSGGAAPYTPAAACKEAEGKGRGGGMGVGVGMGMGVEG